MKMWRLCRQYAWGLPVAIVAGLLSFSFAQDSTALTDTLEDIPGQFSEAPMLQSLVESGDLPPVEERLPKDVEVVTPVEAVGQYGGTWRDFHNEPGMGSLKLYIAYEPPIRWKADYSGYEPGLAKSVEWSEDGTTITFHFREGVKWSDGQPFTTDDLKFWWEELAQNEDYQVVIAPWWARNADGSAATMAFPDPYTWVITFKEAHWITPYTLAQGFWEWSDADDPLKPKHYLEQFLPKNGGSWEQLEQKSKWWENPDHPTVFAWRVSEFTSAQRVVFERNPYYWKVDPEGNQLPYIDRIESEEIPDYQVSLLNVAQGKYDATFRVGSPQGDPNQLPLLAEKAEASGYRIQEGWSIGIGGSPAWLINQNYKARENQENDAAANEIRELLRNQDFRVALSHAIDRNRVIQTAWGGFGTPQQATISPQSWHFQSSEGEALFNEWASAYAEYDVERANTLLDGVMGPKGNNGFRTLKSGEPFRLIVDVNDWGDPAVNLAATSTLEENLEAVGINVLQNNIIGSPEAGLRANGGLYMLRTGAAGELDLMTYPSWIFPNNAERSFPLAGRYYQTGGSEGEEPAADSVEARLHDIYTEMIAQPDVEARHELVRQGIRIHINEGPFFVGASGDQVVPVIIKNNFHNVPTYGVTGPWAPSSPGNMHPEQFFIATE